jgi:hypothetical protein
MLARSLILGLSALAFGAPSASAAVADPVVPFYDAADGVQAGQGKRNVYLRFGPEAARLYRTFAGHTVRVGCGRPAVDVNGGGLNMNPNDGRTELAGGGYVSRDMRLPRKRGRVNFPYTGKPYDVCYIATKERRSDDACMSIGGFPGDPRVCARIVVALTETGRTMVDERARTIELSYVSNAVGDLPARFGATPLARLQHVFGSDVVALEGPDAAPPIGKVGFWQDGQTTVVAALLSDGRRRFVRHDGEVYSTNISELTGGSSDPVRLP